MEEDLVMMPNLQKTKRTSSIAGGSVALAKVSRAGFSVEVLFRSLPKFLPCQTWLARSTFWMRLSTSFAEGS